jgi:hypothetical protein
MSNVSEPVTPAATAPATARPRRHRTDAVSLVFGLIFLLIALGWLVSHQVDVKLEALGWAAAIALIVVGGLGLLAALRRPSEPEPVESRPSPDAGDSLTQ